MKIGYLGPEGTFTHQAALEYGKKHEKFELISFNSIPECLSGVEKNEIDFGVVPIENSIEGTVTFTIDSLIFDVNVVIEEEIILPIKHNLAARKGVKAEEIVKILSHPQALAQCRKKLDESFKDVERIQSASTAKAAHIVKDSNEPWAAICTEAAAKSLGLEILAENIQDENHNATRFLVVSKNGKREPVTEGKTTIVFGTHNKPGELYKILDIISIWDLNMTKIESRPRKDQLGAYVFYVDIESTKAEDIKDALKMIERKTIFFKNLGTYRTT